MNGMARKLSLLVALGAIWLGVAACGSGSSSSSSSKPTGHEGTVASDVIKEASTYRHVQLTVKNGTTAADDPDTGPWFYLCFFVPRNCGPDGEGIKPDLARGGDGITARSPYTTGNADNVEGELSFPVGYTYWQFSANNPVGARPYIHLDQYTTVTSACAAKNLPPPCFVNSGQWPLDEPSAGGTTERTETVGGTTFVLQRSPDTADDIVMTLIARGVVR